MNVGVEEGVAAKEVSKAPMRVGSVVVAGGSWANVGRGRRERSRRVRDTRCGRRAMLDGFADE